MNEIILSHVGNIVTADSRDVANNFEKNHQHVMEAIRKLIDMTSVEISTDLFIESTYLDSYGREQKKYDMTRDGFSLLVMSFTGQAALEWKLKYIKAFNELERRVAKPLSPAEMFLAQAQLSVDLERRTSAIESKTTRLESKVEHIADAMTGVSTIAWTADMNRRINSLCQTHGLNYQTYRSGLYVTLESTLDVTLPPVSAICRNV